MFEWKDDYSVHIGIIDGQHQNLFRMARELHAAMEAGDSKPVLAKLLDRLVQYTQTHFAQEERLMQSAAYPQFAAHHAEHDALIKRVQEFQADFQSGQVVLSIQLLQFLKTWLEQHIMHSDQKYVPYLNAKAVA
jgi:hemerythrin